MKKFKKTWIPFSLIFIFSISVASCDFGTTNTSNYTDEDDGWSDAVEDVNTISLDFIEDLTFSESVNFMNLQIFMITGTAENDDKANPYVPLKRAMDEKHVRIKETSDVNELRIKNNSEHTVFIHAGDIIKGGKQDRTLAYDVIVDANSKSTKLTSFCVESGRWSKRGNEEADEFSSNEKMITSRELKFSSKKEGNQSKVWQAVENTQDKISYNMSSYSGKDVDIKDSQSESSLELALDNEELRDLKEKYLEHFKNILKEEHIGFAYAINGELYNVDIYNSKALFDELFDKLITAAIIEAIAEVDLEDENYSYISLNDVKEELKMNADFEESAENLNKRTRWITQEDGDQVVFTSLDRKNNSVWVHRNIIIKTENMESTGYSEEHYVEGEPAQEEVQEVLWQD